MKNGTFRSSCLIASALDLIGDKWSLLIIRDMLLGKKTFKEFLLADEKIAPGILSSRLKMLLKLGLVTKRKLPENRKENIYLLTEKGIELVPLITEMVFWSDKNVRELNSEMKSRGDIGFEGAKSEMIDEVMGKYRALIQHTLRSSHSNHCDTKRQTTPKE